MSDEAQTLFDKLFQETMVKWIEYEAKSAVKELEFLQKLKNTQNSKDKILRMVRYDRLEPPKVHHE